MAFSIHFLKACCASEVNDKNCFSSHPYSWLDVLSVERRGPEKAHLKVRKYRHKVCRRLPPSRTHGNTVSVTNVGD